MESTEEDIKPTIAADGNLDKSSTVPGVSKLKQSRYEDVWSEDVHAAFMEAVVLYPPMGKRRLKYYRVSMRENEQLSNPNRARSFGRCQLIQSYILEKTGKNRSRKQVSSHLQRLKKIHKDNPAMCHLFSERAHPPPEDCIPQTVDRTSQDTYTNSNDSVSMRHLKSDPDFLVSLQNTDIGAISSSAFSSAAEASSLNGDSCNIFHDQAPFSPPPDLLSPVPRQCGLVGNLHPSNSDYFSELQDAQLFKDTINEGFRSGPAINRSAFSISMCRLAPKLPTPTPSRLADSSPATQMYFSRSLHTPGYPTNHCISHDHSLVESVSYSSAFSPGQGVFCTPFFPVPTVPPAKQRVDPSFVAEWMWPKGFDITPDFREGSFDELHLRYPPAIRYASYPDIGNSPLSHSSSSESESSQLAGGIPYPYKATTSAVFQSDPNEGLVELPRQSPEAFQNLASPLVIRPTPVYPVSYAHASLQSGNRASAPSVFT